MRRPLGVTIIAGIMFLGAAGALVVPDFRVFPVGMIRPLWRLAYCGLYVAAGIGLLRLYRWARTTVIVITVVVLANRAIDLATGLLQSRPHLMLVGVLGIPYCGLILWHMLRPEVRLAFARERINGLRKAEG